MAVTGRGDFPLRTAWFHRKRSRRYHSAALYRPVFPAQSDLAYPTIWRDWVFDGVPGSFYLGVGYGEYDDAVTLDSEIVPVFPTGAGPPPDEGFVGATVVEYADDLVDSESTTSAVYDVQQAEVSVIFTIVSDDPEYEGLEEASLSFVLENIGEPLVVWVTEDFDVTNDPEEAYLSLVFDEGQLEDIVQATVSELEEIERLEEYVSVLNSATTPEVAAGDAVRFDAEVSEPDPVVELEDSALGLIYDEPVVEGLAVIVVDLPDAVDQEELALPESSVTSVVENAPAPDITYNPGTVYSDIEEEIEILEGIVNGLFENPPAFEDSPVVGTSTPEEFPEAEKVEDYGSFQVHAEAPPAGNTDPSIDSVATDLWDELPFDESVVVIHLEDGDTTVLQLELEEWDDPAQLDSAIAYFFEEPVPELEVIYQVTTEPYDAEDTEPTAITYFVEEAPPVTNVMRVWIGRGAVTGTGTRVFIKG